MFVVTCIVSLLMTYKIVIQKWNTQNIYGLFSYSLQRKKFVQITSIITLYSDFFYSRYIINMFVSKYLTKTICSFLSNCLSRCDVQSSCTEPQYWLYIRFFLSLFGRKNICNKTLYTENTSGFHHSPFTTYKFHVQNLNNVNL